MQQTIEHDTSVQDTIIEQLQSSVNRINGVNFFAYTGIRDYVMAGETELKLDMPKNPAGLSHVWIKYNRGTDAYDLTFCKNGFNFPNAQVQEIYCDMLGEVIARNMGVFP